MNQNNLGSKIEFISNFMQNLNNYLTTLHLERCNLGNHGATAVAAYVKNNIKCKIVSLKGNNIESKGAIKFYDVLVRQNHCLASLDLSDNNIGDEGAVAIAKGFENNKIFTRLNMWRNELTMNCSKQVLYSLGRNFTLTSFNITEN